MRICLAASQKFDIRKMLAVRNCARKDGETFTLSNSAKLNFHCACKNVNFHKLAMTVNMRDLFGYKSYIALDIETTGLYPGTDKIIEIGAVRVDEDGSEHVFETFLNPGIRLPEEIVELTGIQPEMLRNAPKFEEIASELLAFLKKDIVIGHNISFDIGFLTDAFLSCGKKPYAPPVIDTLFWARMLYPNATAHSLEALCALLAIEQDDAHRALPDARFTLACAHKLWQRLLSINDNELNTLEFLAGTSGLSDTSQLLANARIARMSEKFEPPELCRKYLMETDNVFGTAYLDTRPFDEREVMHFFENSGELAKTMEHFAVRPQQQGMAKEIITAFENRSILMVEAGTGVGKSFAYLIPAIFRAVATGEKLVISTFTKSLQDQLFSEDIPQVAQCLPFAFKAVLLKGRGNYVCPHRVERLLKNPSLLVMRDREALLPLAVWLEETQSGDLSENTAFMNSSRMGLIEKIRADAHTCVGKKCPHFSRCFVYEVRKKVEDAQIVVVNHALLLSDIDGAIIGTYSDLIVDEAHNLERAAVDAFGGDVNIWVFRAVLDSIFSQGSQLSGTMIYAYNALEQKILEKVEDSFSRAKNAIIAARAFVDNFFAELAGRMDYYLNWKAQRYAVRKRYDNASELLTSVKKLGEEFVRYLKSANESINAFCDIAGESASENAKILVEELRGEALKIAELAQGFVRALTPDDDDLVFWAESPSPDSAESLDARLFWAPLDIGKKLCDTVFDKVNSCVLTSATLTVANSFDYFSSILGFVFVEAERKRTAIFGSPFDYPNQLMAIVPRFFPEPISQNEHYFIKSVVETVRDTSAKTRAGSLVLFTSYSMLREAFQMLKPALTKHHIKLLAQRISGSNTSVARQFLQDHESVLLGTESFWQGFNAPGKTLEILYVTKIPFAVPDDPYPEAICERIRAAGGNPFIQYQVPQAVIRFRQGIGRLIRSESDRGVLVICDPRVVLKRYGDMFTKSLPVPVKTVFSAQELVNAIAAQLKKN